MQHESILKRVDAELVKRCRHAVNHQSMNSRIMIDNISCIARKFEDDLNKGNRGLIPVTKVFEKENLQQRER